MSVHTLKGLMDLLGNYPTLTDEEQAAAHVLGAGVERVLPKGRVWPVLTDDADPALTCIEAVSVDLDEVRDTLALIEDRLTELKRQRMSDATAKCSTVEQDQ